MIDRPLGPLPIDVPVPGASFSDLLDSLGAKPTWPALTGEGAISVPEGTTVLALRFVDGVVMAGDRQATEGHLVAHRRIRKVYPADSLFGSGDSRHRRARHRDGQAVPGRARALREDRRGAAVAGRQRLPSWPGWSAANCPSPSRDWWWSRCLPATTRRESRGRLYTYDVVGGRYEENDFGSTGSGARLAKSYLRTTYQRGLDGRRGRRPGGQGPGRRLSGGHRHRRPRPAPRSIFPNVVRIDAEGVAELDESVVGPLAESAVEEIL